MSRTLERIVAPGPAAFRRHYIQPRRPVIVTGALEAWPRAIRSFRMLARHGGDVTVEVDWMHEAPFVFDRARRTPATTMRLASFIEGGRISLGYVQARSDALTERLRLSATRLPFAPASFLRRIESLWVGGGAGYGLHHDIGSDQLVCQLAGSKQILLLPDDLRTSATLRLEPLRSGRFYRSTIDDPWRDPVAEASRLAGCERYVDTLAPGEVLYIPCAWFHDLRPLEPCITVGHRYYLSAIRCTGGALGSLTRHVLSPASRCLHPDPSCR